MSGTEAIELAREDLVQARDAVLAALDGVGEAQWRFRPAPEAWSIAEIVEHVVLVARNVGGMVSGPLLATPPTDEPKDAIEDLLRRRLRDRSYKATAPERVLPVGTWPSSTALVAAYVAARDELLEWIRTTDAPLRRHRMPHFRFGVMDGVEWLVFLAMHDLRHVAQVEEVKRAPGYPGPA